MISSPDMADDDREDYFAEKHSDEDLLAFIEENEVVTTKEVAEHFDYHLHTVRRRLTAIAERGELNKKDVGKRFVWWIS